MGNTAIKKVNWWHERLADWMIAHPDKQLKEAATYFDVHPQYIYIIHNSDCFKQYWADRSGKTSSEVLADVKDRMLAVTEMALDRIADRLDSQGSVMPVDTLVGISALGMKSLGYGVKAGPTVVVNNNHVDPALLEQARQRMRERHGIEAAEARHTATDLQEVSATALPAPSDS